MAISVDLNELPASSGVTVCVVCRREVSGGRSEKDAAEQPRCSECGGHGGGGRLRDLDMNVVPVDDVEADVTITVRTPPASSSFIDCAGPSTQPIPVPEQTVPENPHMILLQALRDDMAQIWGGDLGEGWCVEFEYCTRTHKETPVYLAPTGARLNTKEDVARYLGFAGPVHAQTRPQGQSSSSGGSIIKDDFTYQFQDFYLISAGTIDPRPSYHSEDRIWPVGYRSAWHDRITGSLFISDVVNGGDSGPIFRISRISCTNEPLPSVSTILTAKGAEPPQNSRNVRAEPGGIIDVFEVEGRSEASAWGKACEALLSAFEETYKMSSDVKLFCHQDGNEARGLDLGDSLARFCFFEHLITIPPVIQNDDELRETGDMLMILLSQDRFGLNLDFVQEIIEQLPGADACLLYKPLRARKDQSSLKTVGRGFLRATRAIDADVRHEPCPLGKPLSLSIPPHLMGDAMQAWELAAHLKEVLHLGKPLSFEEFESELTSDWLIDACSSEFVEDSASPGTWKVSVGSEPRHDLLLGQTIVSLLRLLVNDLVSKASMSIYMSKSRQKLVDQLPIDETTWPEIARRYMLAKLCLEGSPESEGVMHRERGKVFHCLCGDGGILCGSLTGVSALEGDASILADAVKGIFVSLMGNNDIVIQRDADAAEENDVPEWVKPLTPVRTLATNVGARIRNRVHQALKSNPPEWAKTMLEHSIRKEVYKHNSAGPTKRAVVSVLKRFDNENRQARIERTSLTDLISKQCRVVLRLAVSQDRVFCNTFGRSSLWPNNDDWELINNPTAASRPLDFRTIDLRLAAGAYGGSPDAFADDVREVWGRVRTANGDRSDTENSAAILSQTFEELYANEVLTFVRKYPESDDWVDSLLGVRARPLPPAPWEKGLCKACGVDKDDEDVLFCSTCDSEFHLSCLNPPLESIPEGNWHCTLCTDVRSSAHIWPRASVESQISRGKQYPRELTRMFLKELFQMINVLETKECWEFSVNEKILLIKLLCDEALKTAALRDHVVQCKTGPDALERQMCDITNELKLLECNEKAKHVLSRDASESSTLRHGSTSSYGGRTSKKALRALEKKWGPVKRCGCLEPLWTSKHHCKDCHLNFSTNHELIRHHLMGNCKGHAAVFYKRQATEDALRGREDDPKQKKLKSAASHEVALRIHPSWMPRDPKSQSKLVINEPMDNDKPSTSSAGPSKSSIVPKSSSRSLGDRASKFLRILKMDLLDIDAALPRDALRKSRSSRDRRSAWRDFVKSATSIYQMVQAILVLEDMIKSEYLRADWRFWSSPSTAAQITTLSALALRIYVLDLAVSYHQPFQ